MIMSPSRARVAFRPGFTLVLFGVLLVALWVAGGASRADALGQATVRFVAWSCLIVTILFGARRALLDAWQSREVRPALLFLTLALALALLQLIPLPPGLWQALPGRAPMAEAAALSGEAQPWRPLSLVPDATMNAAGSLIVPFVVLLLMGMLDQDERGYIPDLLLAFIVGSVIVGMIQFSLGTVDNIFINESRVAISGTFANRNHFALMLALGCVLAPVWAIGGHGKAAEPSVWRMAMAAGLIVIFLLMILVSGSRAGLGLGAAGIVMGLAISVRAIRKALAPYPRWAFPAAIVGIVVTVALCVLVSVLAGRAQSIDRIVEADRGQEMRVQGLPVVLDMTREYFPVGTGLGGFDPMFRIHEPAALLKPTYFNNAHNDILELVLLAGLPAMVLMLAAAGWWAWMSVKAWRGKPSLAKSGSAILLLIVLASIFDYPARTPAIMAFTVVGAVWLAEAGRARRSSLPEQNPHL
jgi:O-antigen ligase